MSEGAKFALGLAGLAAILLVMAESNALAPIAEGLGVLIAGSSLVVYRNEIASTFKGIGS